MGLPQDGRSDILHTFLAWMRAWAVAGGGARAEGGLRGPWRQRKVAGGQPRPVPTCVCSASGPAGIKGRRLPEVSEFPASPRPPRPASRVQPLCPSTSALAPPPSRAEVPRCA